MTEKITVYVNKKLFTLGIMKIEVDKKNIDGLFCRYGHNNWKSATNNCSIEKNKEWFLTLEEAEDNAKLQVQHEIEKLKIKLVRLENMKKFKVREEK